MAFLRRGMRSPRGVIYRVCQSAARSSAPRSAAGLQAFWIVRSQDMDEALKKKIEEARNRMNSNQAGINVNRTNEDRGMREWARGKQRPANAERVQFRNSLADEERSQIEERIEQLVHDNP